MNIQIKILRQILQQYIEDIDAGNCDISNSECEELAEVIKNYIRKDEPISKYQAYNYLRVSRATFDNYIREGKLPKGKKIQGFTELVWYKKDLDKAIEIINYGKPSKTNK